MACVSSDGKLTESAKTILKSLEATPKSAADLANELSVPLFKVRSSMRDMKSMGLVSEKNDQFHLDTGGKKMLERS